MEKHRSDCPLACTLDELGNQWTLVIIRDMYFEEKHRFEEFLQSKEKISTNILADRLKRLEERGIVSKHTVHTLRV